MPLTKAWSEVSLIAADYFDSRSLWDENLDRAASFSEVRLRENSYVAEPGVGCESNRLTIN
jgi:hypothetical protein